jgi:hypothetical protein
MTKKNDEDLRRREVDRLRDAIEKITHRRPASSDPRYLSQRLADLKKRADAGEDIKHHDEPVSVISISMPSEARELIGRIMKAEHVGASELLRRAIASWARAEGHAKLADALGGAR